MNTVISTDGTRIAYDKKGDGSVSNDGRWGIEHPLVTHGDAGFFGSQGATPLNKPVVGMGA
jgi:hypothetical protein